MRERFLLMLLLQNAFALVKVKIDDFETEYSVTYENLCLSDKERFQVLLGIPISQCVTECGARRHCKTLTYRGMINMCELFLTANADQLSPGNCVLVQKDDIKVVKSLCTKECEYGQACETTGSEKGKCRIKECVNTTAPGNGLILGNERGLGKKIRYKCNTGYRKISADVETDAECLDTGHWSHTIECVKVLYTWTTWSAWGECSVSCGGGNKTRYRTCSIPTTASQNDDHCEDQQLGDTVDECNAHSCPNSTFLGPCDTDADCIENEGMCTQKICLCKHTHFWNNATNNCTRCTSSRNTFVKIKKNRIVDNNLYKIQNGTVTAKACETHCNENKSCSSYETWTGGCSFQSVTLKMVQQNFKNWSSMANADLYLKECAAFIN